ncbi:MAG TPA: HIT family protein [Afifellaceae bacterium]|nr:HIT family protein [Afifellaceae bacterium]
MADFELHPQLAADSRPVTEIELSSVRLIDDSQYPWLLLVPRRPGLVDLTDLAPAERLLLMEEIGLACDALRGAVACDKLNIASLGNQVPQLHIHVIARRTSDVAWPKPVWGAAPPVAYGPGEADSLISRIAGLIGNASTP